MCVSGYERSCSLADPNDVLVNRKGSSLHPRNFAIVSDILTLATSIKDRKCIPRTLVGKWEVFYSLEIIRVMSQRGGMCRCTDLYIYFQQSASSKSLSPVIEAREPKDVSLPIPLPLAQSIASSVIVKDLLAIFSQDQTR